MNGRVRVEIFNEDGSPINPEIQSSKYSPCTTYVETMDAEIDLLKKMGTLIPRLNSRIKRTEEMEAAKQLQLQLQQQQQQQDTQVSAAAAKKKKGKKR